MAKPKKKPNPHRACYYFCDHCEQGYNICTCSDVKKVGPPICPNESCRNHEKGMPEVTAEEYNHKMRHRRLYPDELLDLIKAGLDEVNDVRVKSVTVDNDNKDGELIVATRGGRVMVIRTGDIADYADTEADD